jgi:D-alanyl-D-alanine carboxypeptidase
MNNQYKRRVFISSLLLSLACTGPAISQPTAASQSAKYSENQKLRGGAGADIFPVGEWNTATPKRIDDFAVGIDRIKVGRLGATFATLSIKDSRKGAIISDQEHPIALVEEVKAASLQPESFIFGDPALAEQLQSTLTKAQAGSSTPGVTQAVITPDGFTWEGAAGLSNVTNQTPTKPDDIFGIASVTKAFTAATVLKLAEEGKLSLDDTLEKWRPDIAANIPDGKNITVRQLLNGTSGIRNYTVDEQYQAAVQVNVFSDAKRQFTPEEIVAYIYGKPRFSGGRSSPTWVYPNTGMVIIGLIIEKATGMPYAQAVREQVLNPLGLKHTFLSGKEQSVGNQARSYEDYLKADGSPGRDGTLEDVTNLYPLVLGGPEAGLLSTAQDVARFVNALFGGKLLQPNSLKELVTTVDTPEGPYGLGLPLTPIPDTGAGTAYFPDGSWIGYNAGSGYFRDKKGLTYSLMGNRNVELENFVDLANPQRNSLESIVNTVRPELLKLFP